MFQLLFFRFQEVEEFILGLPFRLFRRIQTNDIPLLSVALSLQLSVSESLLVCPRVVAPLLHSAVEGLASEGDEAVETSGLEQTFPPASLAGTGAETATVNSDAEVSRGENMESAQTLYAFTAVVTAQSTAASAMSSC